jgi:hypothetical protein
MNQSDECEITTFIGLFCSDFRSDEWVSIMTQHRNKRQRWEVENVTYQFSSPNMQRVAVNVCLVGLEYFSFHFNNNNINKTTNKLCFYFSIFFIFEILCR